MDLKSEMVVEEKGSPQNIGENRVVKKKVFEKNIKNLRIRGKSGYQKSKFEIHNMGGTVGGDEVTRRTARGFNLT